MVIRTILCYIMSYNCAQRHEYTCEQFINNNNNNNKQTFKTRQITEVCRKGAHSNVTNRH